MSLNEFYQGCKFPKGKLRSVAQLEDDRATKANEDQVRKKVNARDKHRCFWPRCGAPAVHKHHIVYRSKLGKTSTENEISGCYRHHRWVHDGLIRLFGNADKPPIGIVLTKLGEAAKIRIPERRAA